MNNQIVVGSLGQIAKMSGKSLAESFLSCDVIVIVDTSGSMGSRDSRGGLSRYEVACEELAALQRNLPGKIALISFADEAYFCPGGIPMSTGGSTAMEVVLRFVKIADDIAGMRFFLISDGDPNEPQVTLEIAKTFKNKISTIYVGGENEYGGREFLQRLAEATGGLHVTAEHAKELTEKIETMMLHG